MRRVFELLALLFVAAGIGATIGGYWAYQATREMLDSPLPVEQASTVNVPPGSSFKALAERLAGRDWVEYPLLLRLYARYTGDAMRLQAGEYAVEPGDDVRTLLADITAGNVKRYRFTIVEGWTFAEIMEALAAHKAVKTTLDGSSGKAVMTALGKPEEHPEGRFLPETYRFPRGTRDIELLRRAYDAMSEALEAAWASRKADLPLESPYDALILASIVEKETAAPAERRRIAGVFARRLAKGMRLQTDPTVIYGMGERYSGQIRRRDLRSDNPYNTYTRSGLPPTPIAMPGIASLRAAVDPAPGDALYFVSKGDGTHHFSATLSEHNSAVQRYILDGG